MKQDKFITKVLSLFEKWYRECGLNPETDETASQHEQNGKSLITTAILDERERCTHEVLEVVKKQQIQDSINKFIEVKTRVKHIRCLFQDTEKEIQNILDSLKQNPVQIIAIDHKGNFLDNGIVSVLILYQG